MICMKGIRGRKMTKGFNPTFTITNRITAGLTRIERARGFLEAATLSEAWVREMGRRALDPGSPPHHAYRGNAPDPGAGRAVAGGKTGSRGRPRRCAGTPELPEGLRFRLRVPRKRRPDHGGADPGNPQAAGGRRPGRGRGSGRVPEDSELRGQLHAPGRRSTRRLRRTMCRS